MVAMAVQLHACHSYFILCVSRRRRRQTQAAAAIYAVHDRCPVAGPLPAQVHFSERMKHNLRKVKALDHLAVFVVRLHDRLAALLEPQTQQLASRQRLDEGVSCIATTSHAPVAACLRGAAVSAAGSVAAPADVWNLDCDTDDDDNDNSDGTDTARAPANDEPPPRGDGGSRDSGDAAPAALPQCLMSLRLCLSVLENVTFTCKENERELLNARGDGPPAAGGSSAASVRPFVPELVTLLRLLTRHLGVSPGVAGCANCAAGLLMNLTHEHDEGVAAASDAGVLPAASELLWVCVTPAPDDEAPGSGGGPSGSGCDRSKDGRGGASVASKPTRAAMLRRLDVVTVSLGLLINMTSQAPQHREALRRVVLPARMRSGDGHGDGGGAAVGCVPGGVLSLLCGIFNALEEPHTQQRSLAGGRHVVHGSGSPGHLEVTADDLHAGHFEGEAAIVRSYTAMLLGFVVVDSAAARQAAEATLACRGLQPVVAAIQRTLDFYNYTGAITDACRDSLVSLLAGLERQPSVGS
eukprot:366472-Chlamydomonas_euryale.AAC.7